MCNVQCAIVACKTMNSINSIRNAFIHNITDTLLHAVWVGYCPNLYIEMLRLFIRAAHALKSVKTKTSQHAKQAVERSVRTGIWLRRQEIGHTEIIKIGNFREIGNFKGGSADFLILILYVYRGFIIYIYNREVCKPTPDFPDFPIFPELYFVNKEKAERGINFNVQCAVCSVQCAIVAYKTL